MVFQFMIWSALALGQGVALAESQATTVASTVSVLDSDAAVFRTESQAFLATDVAQLIQDLHVASCVKGRDLSFAQQLGIQGWPMPQKGQELLEGTKKLKAEWRPRVAKLLPLVKMLLYARESLWAQGAPKVVELPASCSKK